MRITTRTRYALRALIDLAGLPAGKTMPLTMLATRQRVRVKYLEQILLNLGRAGIVEGRKGPGGGYYMKRKPETVSIYDIMNAVGESSAPIRCLERGPDKYCAGRTPCMMKQYWRKLQAVIDKYLKSCSIKVFLKKGRVNERRQNIVS